MLYITSEFKSDCQIHSKFHAVLPAGQFRVLRYPREPAQRQCKARNETVQCQVRLRGPEVPSAIWIQLYLENSHTWATAVCLYTSVYTHNTVKQFWKSPQNTKHGKKMSKYLKRVSFKWTFPVLQFYTYYPKTITAFNFSVPENSLEQTTGRHLHIWLELAALHLHCSLHGCILCRSTFRQIKHLTWRHENCRPNFSILMAKPTRDFLKLA